MQYRSQFYYRPVIPLSVCFAATTHSSSRRLTCPRSFAIKTIPRRQRSLMSCSSASIRVCTVRIQSTLSHVVRRGHARGHARPFNALCHLRSFPSVPAPLPRAIIRERIVYSQSVTEIAFGVLFRVGVIKRSGRPKFDMPSVSLRGTVLCPGDFICTPSGVDLHT